MITTGTTATNTGKAVSLKDILAAVEKVNAIPKGKWVLISPDGRAWMDEDIREIAPIFMGFMAQRHGGIF